MSWSPLVARSTFVYFIRETATHYIFLTSRRQNFHRQSAARKCSLAWRQQRNWISLLSRIAAGWIGTDAMPSPTFETDSRAAEPPCTMESRAKHPAQSSCAMTIQARRRANRERCYHPHSMTDSFLSNFFENIFLRRHFHRAFISCGPKFWCASSSHSLGLCKTAFGVHRRKRKEVEKKLFPAVYHYLHP